MTLECVAPDLVPMGLLDFFSTLRTRGYFGVQQAASQCTQSISCFPVMLEIGGNTVTWLLPRVNWLKVKGVSALRSEPLGDGEQVADWTCPVASWP